MENETEKELTKNICAFIKLNYPQVYFFTDPSGMFQKSWAAKQQLKQNRSKHAQLDIIILEPRGKYHGLIIELKREGEKIFKKDGTYMSEHLVAQSISIFNLNNKGYYAAFCVGWDETIKTIKNYLKL